MSIEATAKSAKPGIVLFAYGFRCFFLLAGLYAILPMAMLYWAMTSGRWPADALPLFVWHGHEMLFGFVAAAIAGFLLTAVPTWTNTKAVAGMPLILLVLLWLAGRVVSLPWVPTTSVLVQAVGLAFFPALAVVVSIPLIRTKNYRNLPFVLLLAILFLAEIAFHARYAGWLEGQIPDGVRLVINTVMLMIVIVGGRIIPAFTRNALRAMGRNATMRDQPAIDLAAIFSVIAVLLGDLFAIDSTTTGVLAALSAGFLLIRLTGWGGLRTLDVPLLWVLHLGTGWLIFALTLKSLWLLVGFGWAINWMHAFTAGVFGTMILGVMTRVALGHTGRILEVSWAVVVSYVLVSAAALIRIFGPWFAQNAYIQILTVAIAAWIGAFLIFSMVYIPVLLKPRPDGKAG